MAGIDPSRIPSRPNSPQPVRRTRRAPGIEKLHEAPEDRAPREIVPTVETERRTPAESVSAPSAEYQRPLVGMSRDRMIASLTRIEHTIARLQERDAELGEATEMTLARMMIGEHLRRLRIVGEATDEAQSAMRGGVR